MIADWDKEVIVNILFGYLIGLLNNPAVYLIAAIKVQHYAEYREHRSAFAVMGWQMGVRRCFRHAMNYVSKDLVHSF